MAIQEEEGYLVEGVVLVQFTTIEDTPRTFYTKCASEITGKSVKIEGAEITWECREGIRAQKKRNDILTGHDGTITDMLFAPELFGAVSNASWDPIAKKFVATPVGEDSTQVPCDITFYSEADEAESGVQGYASILLPRCTCEITNLISATNDAAYTKYEMEFKSRPNRGEAPYEIDFIAQLPGEVVS